MFDSKRRPVLVASALIALLTATSTFLLAIAPPPLSSTDATESAEVHPARASQAHTELATNFNPSQG